MGLFLSIAVDLGDELLGPPGLYPTHDDRPDLVRRLSEATWPSSKRSQLMLDPPTVSGRRKAIGGNYDDVIIGAGSAGCVVAYRLVEGADATILLLEAGSADEGVASIAPDRGWLGRLRPICAAYGE
jgi:GMC oxidoreductase